MDIRLLEVVVEWLIRLGNDAFLFIHYCYHLSAWLCLLILHAFG